MSHISVPKKVQLTVLYASLIVSCSNSGSLRVFVLDFIFVSVIKSCALFKTHLTSAFFFNLDKKLRNVF